MNTLIFLSTVLCAGFISGFAEFNVQDTSSDAYTIIVTATRRAEPLRNTPGIAYVLDEEALTATNAKTAADVFKYVPGLDLEAGTGVGTPSKQTVSMNGTPSFHTLVLLDGKRLLSSHFHTGTDVNLVPAGNIERIEVVKDAGSALYGSDALGGVINIITKKGGASPSLSVTGRIGTENTAAGDLSLTGPVNANLFHSLYTSWEKSDGLPIDTANSRSGQLNYKQLTISDRIDCRIGERGTIGASVHYVEENDLQWRGALYDSWLFMPGLDVSLKLKDDLSLASAVYYSQWNSDISNEKNTVGCPSLWLTYSGISRNVLIGGGEYAWRGFQRDGVKNNHQSLLAAFLQDEYAPFSQLTLLGAARMDYVDNGANGSDNTGPVISPKLSVLYRPVKMLGVRAGAGHGFRAPTVQDLMESRYHPAGGGIWRYGSHSLKPEYSTNVNGGLELSLLKNLTLIGNGYLYRLTDMIALVSGERDTVYQGRNVPVIERKNINDYTIRSAEFFVHYRMKPLVFEAGASGSWQKSDDTDGEDVLFYPGRNAFGKLYADIEWRALSLSPYAGLSACFGRKSPGGDELRNYKNLQAGLTLSFAKRYELFVNGVNLLCQEMDVYEDALYTIKGESRVDGGFRVKVY
ncbi:MAG: hypothetical protein A2268_04460 [Candidatus Raymondbacteria bacterium RifOxyA12_full_50_37]|uniref:TonB-dependent receptor n=1 Tax=Candidatus Raymondbacteria bacterium RIFOXYD12_FULL_49_13 TaxID=1817890 RepID=A0A1F7FAY7_UNCRA|nr:MAG: hypothetical protein A2268_04460 [Candidatus Raymondbacteria bacterium RifOxyA12_full_50_37]OGJ87718.1 MAG: hypothetical protein A2350_13705 [Candidatus Raymondbacteria bacterium RifOxyB12_full_50_8]OGJ92527.1 MAG: hypothetical protein A2248_05490 [Candidatus Raymondbacteria bacterium RIFOXYA2_FULL_49_16]OGJ97881.1 MAG: hypothetical protein A2453_02515 [Candidatus Raymondbacteria bacterium RIFOXYC2_FULL_50_21]OGK03840.1 MAG: hypothetical protein A2519_02300 [Candidatus Raymondbacteria b